MHPVGGWRRRGALPADFRIAGGAEVDLRPIELGQCAKADCRTTGAAKQVGRRQRLKDWRRSGYRQQLATIEAERLAPLLPRPYMCALRMRMKRMKRMKGGYSCARRGGERGVLA